MKYDLRAALRVLYVYQDATVEHRLGIQDGIASYFEEATGDIYRELTKDQPDFGYIGEKIRRLMGLERLNEADVEQTVRAKKYERFTPRKMRAHAKRVMVLADVTAALLLDSPRRRAMIGALALNNNIALWLDAPSVVAARLLAGQVRELIVILDRVR